MYQSVLGLFGIWALGLVQGAPKVGLTATLGEPVMAAHVSQRAYVKVGLSGLDAGSTGQRPPVNLALVLDRSGSMGGEKIQKAKEAALMVLERLAPDDIVSVITYDSTVEVLVPATKVQDRQRLIAKISALSPRGSTALFAGVSRGLEEVRKFLDEQRVNRVILLSDGQANVGPSSPNALGQLGAAAGKEGIAVSTIGLGLGYNEDLMAQLAGQSDGNHAFAENALALAQIFESELSDVMSVVAQEVSVKVKLKDGVRPIRVLNRDAEIHGQTVYLSLNQLYAKQEKYFLLEVNVPPHQGGAQIELATIEVTYSNMASVKTVRMNEVLAARFSDRPEEVAQYRRNDVLAAAVEAIAVITNREAVALRDQGEVERAEQILLDNAAYLRSSAQKYKSKRLSTYGDANAVDAQNLRGNRWRKQRKSMRKQQYELETQQSY